MLQLFPFSRLRCPNCLDCPSCKHTLSTRATSVALPDPNDSSKVTTKKVYYLACGFCRISDKEVGRSLELFTCMSGQLSGLGDFT